MNKNRLIILAVILAAFFIIIKMDWRPSIDHEQLRKESIDQDNAYTVK